MKSPNLTSIDLKLPISCIELVKKKNKVKKNDKIDGEDKILSILSSLKENEVEQITISSLEECIKDKLLIWFPHISETMSSEAPFVSILIKSIVKTVGNKVNVGFLYSKMEKLNVLIKTDINKLLDSERELYH